MAFLVGGANTLTAGYNIDNSLRVDDGDDVDLTFTPTSTGSKKVMTLSCWVKRGNLTSHQALMGARGAADGISKMIRFDGNDAITINHVISNTDKIEHITDRVFRDASAWYHIVVALNTAQAASTNGLKLYINGVRETSFATSTYTQNTELWYNTDDIAMTVATNADKDQPFDGYISEFYWIDGTQYAASDFGEFDEDSGIWKPKKADVTFGTNGFFLAFKESAVGSGSASTIGADTSGNTHHYTSTNIAVTDQTTDTPTNNFATFLPIMTYPGIVSGTITPLAFSEGNTKVTGSGSGTGFTPAIGSIGVSNGKWYYEFYTSTDDSGTKVGGAMDNDFTASGDKDLGDAFYGVRASNGTFYYNDSTNGSLSNATEFKDDGDILSVALNLDDMEISFSTNGASYTAAQSITGNTATSGTLHPAIYLADDEVATVNFGNPHWALSSGVADANGYGSFEFAPPSGYFALCTKNLAEYG